MIQYIELSSSNDIEMFSFLRNLFEDNRIPTIPFLEFYKKISQLKENEVFPYEYNLPQGISFPESFWEELVKIYRMTLKDGKEREVSIFEVDGDLVFTSVTKGDEQSVVSNHQISVKYQIHPTRRNYYRKEIYLDGKIYKRIDVYYKSVPKKVTIHFLLNLHSHPKVGDQYPFLSLQDIKSQLSSNAVVSGLITDRLWLIVRTEKTSKEVLLTQEEVTVENLRTRMAMICYCANLNGKAIRQ